MSDKFNNILLLSAHDHRGGAARIAWYLFEEYNKRALNAHFAVGKKSISDDKIWKIDHGKYMNPKILWKAKKWFDLQMGIENFNFPGTKNIPSYHPQRPDIIHAHNLQVKYFDLRVLNKITAKFPVLLTLHDTWMFSGHCAFFIKCERWKTGCGKCPDLQRTPSVRRDATRYNWHRKQKIYSKAKLFIASPSQWLIDELESSMLYPSVLEARVVHNGVDTDNYKKGDKAQLKKEKDIPQDAFVMLYVVSNRMKVNKYKDFETIEKTIELLQRNYKGNKKIIFLGLGAEGETEMQGNIEKRFIPYQTDIKEIAKYYQLSDIYVHAARAENFPNVILEALACGTPVVATEVGGIGEQIKEGITGHCVPFRDAQLLSKRIIGLIDDKEKLQKMSDEAIKDVLSRFTLNHMVENYLAFYDKMLMMWRPNNIYDY